MTIYHVLIGLAGLFCIGLACLLPTRSNSARPTADDGRLRVGNLVLWATLLAFIGLLAVAAAG